MHLVSSLRGHVARRRGLFFDALMSCFPAGHGFPALPKCAPWKSSKSWKKTRRGIYAGGILYLDFAGNLDSCIALRTYGHQKWCGAHSGGPGASLPTPRPKAKFDESVNKSQGAAARVGSGAWRGREKGKGKS